MSETVDREEPKEPDAPDLAAPESLADEPKDDEGEVLNDEVDVRDLLRSALEPPPPKAKEDVILLKGVQQRLRRRSKGKFYADGWSTSRSPRSTYLATSIFMLVLIAFVFLILIPWSGGALP